MIARSGGRIRLRLNTYEFEVTPCAWFRVARLGPFDKLSHRSGVWRIWGKSNVKGQMSNVKNDPLCLVTWCFPGPFDKQSHRGGECLAHLGVVWSTFGCTGPACLAAGEPAGGFSGGIWVCRPFFPGFGGCADMVGVAVFWWTWISRTFRCSRAGRRAGWGLRLPDPGPGSPA
jgi:hypothetical protein